ncbi:zinc finger protein ZFAT-like isoform X2 [Cololabis saira]|uniref:zinc finger protein ZFAT-like isoform X2 n=1 Tax=Cololabis saira TaxID=129043 RepID=UPI002AD1EC92|nr:zinc finger protein ZFAT-like isoform X2 [Cololabis saira]
MHGQKKAGSVFMCRICNLFSPSRSQLLDHCSQLHPQEDPPDNIIIALQPLEAEPVEQLPEAPAKRKRGRPKGSTKKKCTDLIQGQDDTTNSLGDDFKREDARNQEGNQTDNSVQGESKDGSIGLECRICHRSFSNKRQILKHICLREEDEEEDERENGSICNGKEGERSDGEDSNQTRRNSSRQRLPKEKSGSSFRPPGNNRNCLSNGKGQTMGHKKPVVNVVLTEDETFPGVSKMVPVEETSAETESSGVPPQPKHHPNEVKTSENNDATDQELSSNLSTATPGTSKGFQEYSIKQDATNLPPSQLKIFACEFCYKIFKFRHSLVAHLRTHTQEKPFQCPHCDYASAIKANLNVHLRKHTGEKFSCQHCSFNCLSPGHLKVHIERVHLKMKQRCSFCDKKYSDVKNLLKHMEKRHDLKDLAVSQKYQQLRLKTRQGLRELLYHCPTCHRRFKNELERDRHLLIHGPQRPFACLLCDHAATKMTLLTAHVRKHLFIYICCVCDEKLVSSQRLRSHLEESHPELDQEQAFTNCINISYYLIPPENHKMGEDGGGHGAEGEERQDKEEEQLREARSHEKEEEQTGSLEKNLKVVRVIEREVEKEGGLNAGAQEASQEICKESTAVEKLNNTAASTSAGERPEDNLHASLSAESLHVPVTEDRTQENVGVEINTSAAKHTHTSPSAGNTNIDLKRDTHLSSGPEDNNGQTPAPDQVLHQNAFQQVLSSLQKTQLDMETFLKLRKIYGDLECQFCGKLFWYKVHFNVHVRTHTKEHLHYCSKCSYSSITKSSLKRHQIQKHSGLLLPCSSPGCKYTTPDKYKLQAHMRTHHEQGRSVTCPVCHCGFPEHRLKRHIKSFHPDMVPVRGKGLMVQRAEKCPYCESYFLKNSSDFQQHIWAHQGLKPYVCSVCNYTGRSRSNLKTHMNRHNLERHHLCDLCGKKFKSKLTLKSHRLSHTDEGKRFQCSECDFTSVFKPSLLRHMEQHAKFKPFRCAHCHYSCNIAGALKRHYNMKHPDQTYENAGPGLPNSDTLKQQGGMKCPECDFVYGTKWELNRHLKSKHSMKVVEATWEVAEEMETHFVSVDNEEHLTEAPLAVLEENVNIQQITEFSSEAQDAVTSMVAMAPGTVTVVQQLQVAEEQEVGSCGDQVMVVNTDGELDGNQVMVVEDAHGLEALTVLTQGENAHHYIVYVQEQTVEIN